MTTSPANGRGTRLARLADSTFDLLVVGGGATGAAVARDAALRGLRVALCERDDFAARTSSASSKLIHGGLRYLQYGDLSLVFEGLRERRILLQTAPHLCWPIDFVFPVYRGRAPGMRALGVGIRLYNALGLHRPPSHHERMDVARVLREYPLLRAPELVGAQLYRDCQTNDARLVIENVLDAEAAGAVCLPHVEVRAPLWSRAGALRGARVFDRLEGRDIDVRAHLVVNAAGPYSDWFRRRFLGEAPPRLRPTRGVHLVLDADRLPTAGRALVLRTRQDGRLYFVLPAGPRTLVGTTDTDVTTHPPGPEPGPVANAADVIYLLDALAHDFPGAGLGPDDVIASFAGLRPLIASDADSPSATSREHAFYLERPGLLTVAGGKLTTLRRMAEEIVDQAIEACAARGHRPVTGPCLTRDRPLPGAQPAPPAATLDADLHRHLEARYGSRHGLLVARLHASPELAAPLVPGLPDRLVEVEHAVTHELAFTPEDVLARRLSLFTHDRAQGLSALPRVLALMAQALDWTPARCLEMRARYEAAVAHSRAWQRDVSRAPPAAPP